MSFSAHIPTSLFDGVHEAFADSPGQSKFYEQRKLGICYSMRGEKFRFLKDDYDEQTDSYGCRFRGGKSLIGMVSFGAPSKKSNGATLQKRQSRYPTEQS